MHFPIKPRALIRRQAADWLVRLDGDPSPENMSAFRRWRASNPRHDAEARKAEAVLSEAALLKGASLANTGRLQKAPTREQTPSYALAASIAAVLIAAPSLYLVLSRFVLQRTEIVAIMLKTDVGEIRTVSLPDGSSVVLDTATAVRIELSKDHRKAVLEHGRARFSIARAGVPFEVQAGTKSVEIAQGVLDLSRLPQGPELDLLSGTAQLASPGRVDKSSILQAPAVVGARAASPQEPVGAETAKVDWTSGKLSFAGARLGDVVASANRYTTKQIIIGDLKIEDLKVTGIVRPGDAANLARSLAAAFSLRVTVDAAGNLRLERQSAARELKRGSESH